MSFFLDLFGIFQGKEGKQGRMKDLHTLTASEALQRIHAGTLTVEDYAIALLDRIKVRDDAVKAWAFLDREHVLKQARALDKVPRDERGPLHGLPIGVKDVIYTKGRWTAFCPECWWYSELLFVLTVSKICRLATTRPYTKTASPRSTPHPS